MLDHLNGGPEGLGGQVKSLGLDLLGLWEPPSLPSLLLADLDSGLSFLA